MKQIGIIASMILLMLLCTQVAHSLTADAAWIQISLLNQNPNPARAGDTVDLRFKVVNMGGQSADNVIVELLQDYPFTVVSGEAVKNLGSLDAYQTESKYLDLPYTVKIDKDAVQGQKQVRLRYQNDGGTWQIVDFNINIVTREFAQIIINKAKLSPGTETELTFTIVNSGNAPLQNMVFSWQEPTGSVLPVYSSDTKYVKYLDVGKSVDLSYTVIADVNAKPGLYQLVMSLRSESATNATQAQVSTKAGIFIGGTTDFDVAFSESSLGQTSLSVANTGNNPAQSVSVKIPAQESFRVSGTSSAIIGNLDKGDYTIVSFQITQATVMNFSSGARQSAVQNSQQAQRFGNMTPAARTNITSNALKVLIEYTDTTGQRQSVEKLVPIQFRATDVTSAVGTRTSGRSSFIGSTSFWVIIFVVAIAAGAGIFIMRRKKQRVMKLVMKKK